MTSTPTRRLRCHHDRAGDDQLPPPEWPTSPSIIDDITDLLEPLPVHRRWGLIAYLSERYYEGWRPGRAEIADLVADLGLPTVNEYHPRTVRRYTTADPAPAPSSVPDTAVTSTPTALTSTPPL
jgi:hypothetical protein